MREYNNGLKRINKTTARNLFNRGIEILACPCKIDPCNPWGLVFTLETTLTENFDTAVNNITYYNCNYETGYYLAYYILIP